MLHDLAASQTAVIVTSSDMYTGSQNRLDLIQSLVPRTVYVLGIYIMFCLFVVNC